MVLNHYFKERTFPLEELHLKTLYFIFLIFQL
jgi:hypothetical protein